MQGGGGGEEGGEGKFNVSISCSEFSGGRGAVLLRQLCLRDDCYRFSIWFCFSDSRHFLLGAGLLCFSERFRSSLRSAYSLCTDVFLTKSDYSNGSGGRRLVRQFPRVQLSKYLDAMSLWLYLYTPSDTIVCCTRVKWLLLSWPAVEKRVLLVTHSL